MKGGSHRYDLVVLGGGTAGLVSSGAAAGLEPVQPRIDFTRVMEHVARAIATVAPHDSPERLRAVGVEVIEAEGRFVAPGRIETAGRTLRWRTAIIATGSHPVLPPLTGLDQAQALTTENLWDLRELPPRLVVLGGGPIGCELAQAFARLGSHVTLVELADRLLLKEEPEASALIADRLCSEGVDIRTRTRARGVHDGELLLEGGETLAFDRILVAAGRAPRSAAIGLDRVGVNIDDRGAVIVDDRLRARSRGSRSPTPRSRASACPKRRRASAGATA